MLNDAPNCGDSGAMSRDAGQTAPCRPAAVTVHDDGYMQLFVNFTSHSTVTSQTSLCGCQDPLHLSLFRANRRQTILCNSFYRDPDFLCRIPVLRCVLWD